MPAIYVVNDPYSYPVGRVYLLTKETAEWVCMDLARKTVYARDFNVKKRYVKKDSTAMKRAEYNEEHFYPRMTYEQELGDWMTIQIQLWQKGKLEASKVAKLEEGFQKLGMTAEQVARIYGV